MINDNIILSGSENNHKKSFSKKTTGCHKGHTYPVSALVVTYNNNS